LSSIGCEDQEHPCLLLSNCLLVKKKTNGKREKRKERERERELLHYLVPMVILSSTDSPSIGASLDKVKESPFKLQFEASNCKMMETLVIVFNEGKH
jgi:hypothetical protein